MKQYLAHAALFAVSMIYAFNYFIAKDLFSEIGPLGVVSIRAISAVVFFWIVHVLWIREKIQSRQDYLRLFFSGILGISLNQIFFFSGLARTLQVNASVLMTTTPVFVFLIGFLMRVEKINATKVFGLVLACVSAVLLILGGRELSFNQQTLTGDLMVIFNASVYGLYLIVVKPLVAKYNPMTIMVWVFTFGSLVNIPLGIPELMAVDAASLSVSALWSVAYVVFFNTICVYSFNAFALQSVPPSIASIYIYLQPVMVSVLAFFLLEEGVSVEELIYIAMVLTGVYLVSYKKRPN